jgi:hypothetical protein
MEDSPVVLSKWGGSCGPMHWSLLVGLLDRWGGRAGPIAVGSLSRGLTRPSLNSSFASLVLELLPSRSDTVLWSLLVDLVAKLGGRAGPIADRDVTWEFFESSLVPLGGDEPSPAGDLLLSLFSGSLLVDTTRNSSE